MTYAIVKTGGKQYRVSPGESLLVERLTADEGDKVALEPLLVRDGDQLAGAGELGKATVSARVVAHERGPKIHVLKFKPKRGYKRRTGHRQELTRLEVTEIKLGTRAKAPAAKAEGSPKGEAKSGTAKSKAAGSAKSKTAAKPTGSKAKAADRPATRARPASGSKPARKRPAKSKEGDDGS